MLAPRPHRTDDRRRKTADGPRGEIPRPSSPAGEGLRVRRRSPTRRATRFSTGPTAMPGAWRSPPPAQPPGVAKRRIGRLNGETGMTDLETCKKMLDEVTTIGTMDVRTEASHVAQWCRAGLGEKELASFRQDVAEELTRRRLMIVPTSEMQFHNRRLAVLEAAVDVLKGRDA
jgi:hypothetical protein